MSFADQLAWELIMNPWRPSQDQPAMPRRSSAPAGEDNKEETPVSVSPIDTAASRPPRQPCVRLGSNFTASTSASYANSWGVTFVGSRHRITARSAHSIMTAQCLFAKEFVKEGRPVSKAMKKLQQPSIFNKNLVYYRLKGAECDKNSAWTPK